MEELIRRRGRIKAKLTRICSFGEQCDANAASAVDIQIKLEMLAEIWSDFETTQTKIECECQDCDLVTQQQEQVDFEAKFCMIKAKLMTTSAQSFTPGVSGTARIERPNVKLPAIELPVFTGDYKKWATFSDLFQSIIHQNTALSPVQKLHYLKSSIRGDASGLLNSIAITDANYLEAWKILRDRYSNRRQVIQSHLKSMYSQARLTSEASGELRKLLDVTVENVRALHALDLPTDEWDCLLVFLVTERLDSSTRRHWELSLGDAQNPTFEDLKDFIEKRCRALEATGPVMKATAASTKSLNVKPPRRPTATSYHVTTEACVKCKGKHPLHSCEQFRRLTIERRIELVKSSSLCFNCMKSGHIARECKLSHCRKCNQRHSTLLHRETAAVETTADNDGSTVQGLHSNTQVGLTQILLATAIVNVKDLMGSAQSIRALLDSGSQATFITEACVQRLGLKRQRTNVTIGGLGASNVAVCKGVVHLHLMSRNTSSTYQIQAFILHRLTGIVPHQPVDPSCLAATIRGHQLNLADPNYHCPGHIDILLGADIYLELIQPGRIKDLKNNTILQNTSLGWIISGPIQTKTNHLVITSHLGLQDLNLQLKAFWELEESTLAKQLSLEEIKCEAHFKRTHSRDKDGRFVVMLPFKENLPELGDSSHIATRRLFQMEKRLELKPECRQAYNEFMAEYVNLGHMETVCSNNGTNCYYLPHHYVLKEASLTTKLRIVFDGTVLPNEGIALNDTLMVGPTIQQELFDIIMRFRMHNFVLIADIEKMYRQILIHPDHQDYQRIKWRPSKTQPIQDYRLKTVTYGTASAPFLAVRCLHQLAEIGEATHPLASIIIKRDFYVDDLLTGASTVEEAEEIQAQLIDLMSSAGLHLHKWSSNSNQLIEKLPKDIQNKDSIMKLTNDSIKTLGIEWQPGSDDFKFRVTKDTMSKLTKRNVVSQISRLFDPFGWLAPVVVRAKIIIQQLWLLGIGWDEELPADLAQDWRSYYNELSSLENVVIPRQLKVASSTSDQQLHGFCDASEVAYGAVVVMRSESDHQTVIRVVCSKTKVAPLKKISLPRLELCGALVLSRLLKRVMTTLTIPSDRIYAWTDSTVVLSWIRKPPHWWKTFVANRVTEIQELVPPDRWGHVPTKDNPADCLSRGLNPNQLINHTLWWSGPGWLSANKSHWPQHNSTEDSVAVSEMKTATRQTYTSTLNASITLDDYSSLSRLVRVTCYCQRFLANCRLPKSSRMKGLLTVRELQESLFLWIRRAQAESFNQEIQCCRLNKSLPTKSTLISLSPFVDSSGLLRVGGRLQHATLTYDQKHPLLLPQHHALTILIIRHAHLTHLHAGPQLLQAVLRRKYWIIRDKSATKQQIHKCVKCFRQRAVTAQQQMGNLPRSRVEPVRAFMRCGIDYAGPIHLKLSRGRGQGKTHKAYICIFVCFTTKAIHIELVNDLTTASFIAAFRRFTNRRGRPSDIYSDCGTNFVGADRLLKELGHLLTSGHNRQLTRALGDDGINWHFNPPSSPHFGGLWEAGVRSIKFHLRRIIGNVILTFEEMYTVLTQIEACLNSRPLGPISSDPDELAALTPGHFLIGDALVAVPDQSVTTLNVNRLTRWQLVQRLFQHFWKQWSGEYLSRLQQRPKWAQKKPNVTVGDLILLKERDCSPLHWPMGRVIEVHPGEDGLVRVVTVRTATGVVKRPTTKCCVMPCDTEGTTDSLGQC